MQLLENYLDYLNQEQIAATAGKFLGKNIAQGAVTGATWGLLYIPATILAWKTANLLFSKATRKCGGIRKSTPGFKVCVARERIKALNQKMVVAKKILSGCHGAKNPDICKQKWTLEIEKAKNKININQSKINEILGEQTNLQEILPAVPLVVGTAVSIAAGMVVDKLLFFVNRSVQAMFSQAVRKCGVYKDNSQRNLCLSKMKYAALTQKLTKLMAIATKCKGDKNPEKCTMKVNKHIEKTRRDLQIQKDNITAYSKELEIEKREAQLKSAMKNQKSKI